MTDVRDWDKCSECDGSISSGKYDRWLAAANDYKAPRPRERLTCGAKCEQAGFVLPTRTGAHHERHALRRLSTRPNRDVDDRSLHIASVRCVYRIGSTGRRRSRHGAWVAQTSRGHPVGCVRTAASVACVLRCSVRSVWRKHRARTSVGSGFSVRSAASSRSRIGAVFGVVAIDYNE